MKGPGLRIDLDVRRVWRCPKCGRTVRTAAPVISQRCGCSDQGQWMRLEPPVKREPFRAPPREPIPDDDDLAEPQAASAPPTAESPPAPVVADQQQVEPQPVADQQTGEQPPSTPQPVAPSVVEQRAEPEATQPAPSEAMSAGSDPAPLPPADDFGAGVEENSAERPQ